MFSFEWAEWNSFIWKKPGSRLLSVLEMRIVGTSFSDYYVILAEYIKTAIKNV